MIKNNLNISARAARSARAYFTFENLFDVLCKTTKTIDLLKTSAHDMKRLLLSQYFKYAHASLILSSVGVCRLIPYFDRPETILDSNL